MKQNIKTALTIFGVIILIAIGNFIYQNLQGIGPAVLPPKDDITKGENTTGLPLKLPDGFSISIYASGLTSPRVIEHEPGGNLIVSEMGAGRVTVLIDANQDGKAEKKTPVISGLNRPHGLAFRCAGEPVNPPNCKIYIAETHQVVEYDYDEVNMKAVSPKKIMDLPNDGGHTSRSLLFMPYPNEDELLISIGSSCNVCDEANDKRAAIWKYNVKTDESSLFARGLRNAVFMEIHPVTGKIWATEMGRDLLGDNIPPDEINIVEEGKNYGWPICYGKNIHDTNFDKKTYIRNPCMEPFETPSYIDLQAHSAPLGLAFIPEEGWSEEMWHNLIVAYHGSWNRSVPTGYKLVRFKLDPQGKVLSGPEDFITGWLNNPTEENQALGRPVDVVIQSGGAIYISDDKAGVIYLVKLNRMPND